jgi:hypothetical protein
MKHAFEMGSSAMIYIPSLIKTDSAIEQLMGGWEVHRHTDGMVIALAYFIVSKSGK